MAGGSRAASGFMISSKAAENPNFLALLQFADWLYYSDQGLEFAKFGVEGTTFTKDGDTRTLAPDVDWNGVNPAGTKKLNADFGFSNGVWSLANGSTDEPDLGAEHRGGQRRSSSRCRARRSCH